MWSVSSFIFRNPEVYTVLALENASEDEDVEGDCVGEMLDLHKRSIIEAQSIEKHDVRIFFFCFLFLVIFIWLYLI